MDKTREITDDEIRKACKELWNIDIMDSQVEYMKKIFSNAENFLIMPPSIGRSQVEEMKIFLSLLHGKDVIISMKGGVK